MNQKQGAIDRQAAMYPLQKLSTVSMAGIKVGLFDRGTDRDVVSLDFHGFDTVDQQPTKSALGLIAGKENGRSFGR